MRAMVWSHDCGPGMTGGSRRHRAMRLPVPFLLVPPVALGLLVAGAVVLALGLALVATVATVAAVLFSVAAVGGIFAVLGFVAWQVVRHSVPGLHRRRRGKRGRRRESEREPLETRDTPVDLLRRRYAAGEIGQTAFRQQLTDLLKERYVRGDLTLAEFESRVQHLYRDPALQPPAA